MKKFIAALLILALMLPLAALAASPTYSSTKAFLNLLDSNNVKYTYKGLDKDNDDHVTISYDGDSYTLTLHWYFTEDNKHVSVRGWDLISYKAADFQKVVKAVNEINSAYKYVTFEVDTSDNTVTVSYDFITPDGGSADVCLEVLVRIVMIVDDAFPTLEPYNK